MPKLDNAYHWRDIINTCPSINRASILQNVWWIWKDAGGGQANMTGAHGGYGACMPLSQLNGFEVTFLLSTSTDCDV